MDPKTFDALQPLLDKFAELAEKHFGSEEIHDLLTRFSNILGKGRIASVTMTVEVNEEEGQRSLPLLTTGLSAFVGKPPFRTWGDSTPQRYVIEDGIQVVPHDRCPKCWEVWDFKMHDPSCPHCGITMGDGCKLLLDTDECPWCQEGRVTVTSPRCDKCGYEVDRKTVVWG